MLRIEPRAAGWAAIKLWAASLLCLMVTIAFLVTKSFLTNVLMLQWAKLLTWVVDLVKEQLWKDWSLCRGLERSRVSNTAFSYLIYWNWCFLTGTSVELKAKKREKNSARPTSCLFSMHASVQRRPPSGDEVLVRRNSAARFRSSHYF